MASRFVEYRMRPPLGRGRQRARERERERERVRERERGEGCSQVSSTCVAVILAHSPGPLLPFQTILLFRVTFFHFFSIDKSSGASFEFFFAIVKSRTRHEGGTTPWKSDIRLLKKRKMQSFRESIFSHANTDHGNNNNCLEEIYTERGSIVFTRFLEDRMGDRRRGEYREETRRSIDRS